MPTQIYHPFEKSNFSNSTCFLSGQKLSIRRRKDTGFPAMADEPLRVWKNQPFKLLDESMATYKDLKLTLCRTGK